jgi:putative membrane protein insertion efficiency factor
MVVWIKKLGLYICLAPIYLYRFCISPLIAPRCRFIPTCSEYATDAFKQHGVLKGGALTAKRMCKCHCFYKGDRLDPVPPQKTSKKTADEIDT